MLAVDEDFVVVESEVAMVIHQDNEVAADESDLEENPVEEV